MILGIDIETTSNVNLKQTGVYKYVEDPGFKILMFAFKIDTGPVRIIDLTKHSLPVYLVNMLTDAGITKTAHNANFERICLQKHTGLTLPVDQWDCTLVRAALLTLPLSLDECSTVLGTEAKDREGKALIRFFSTGKHKPEDALDKWQRFKRYCCKDVIAEQDIRQKTLAYDVPDFERRLYLLDQKINDRGVSVNKTLINNAIKLEALHTAKLNKEIRTLTGVTNPNSVAQLKAWINANGVTLTSLNKEALKQKTDDDRVNTLLSLRAQTAKTSVKKYVAMLSGACKDGRLRGLLQYYGANRTGRWAGRLVQVQNLPRISLNAARLDLARELVLHGDYEALEWIYGDVNNILSQLIRTAFVAPQGKTLVISDFSAIEARVTAWLCGERWRLDVFNSHGMIYETSASNMFSVPVESIVYKDVNGKKVEGVNYPMRQKGKVAELALGYGGGVHALEIMGGAAMGLSIDEMIDIVKRWRKASPRIVKFWYNVQDVVKSVILTRRGKRFAGLDFYMRGGTLFIRLPSGRRLTYLHPGIDTNGRITYKGVNQLNKKWCTLSTWGGKILENLVQAIARDCLADAMLRLDALGYELIMHVHDEIVAEVNEINAERDVKTINDEMAKPIEWAQGLPLKAETFKSKYYTK